MVRTSIQEALERNTQELTRLTGALEARNQTDGQLVTMWTKTLDQSEKRDRRTNILIWALVIAIIFLATGQILPMFGF